MTAQKKSCILPLALDTDILHRSGCDLHIQYLDSCSAKSKGGKLQ